MNSKAPFQDGNGRLSRALTNLQLLQAGYSHASYSSLESVVEHNKEAYYLALRRTQTSFREENVEWEPWLNFFLKAMRSQIERLRQRMSELAIAKEHPSGPNTDLSPLAENLLQHLTSRGSLSVSEAANALGANRNTLKGKFAELVSKGLVELHGSGRGAHYRLVGKAIPPPS